MKTNKEKEGMKMSNITDKVVVITGASSGLGESTARHLAKLGATVVLGARRKGRLAKSFDGSWQDPLGAIETKGKELQHAS